MKLSSAIILLLIAGCTTSGITGIIPQKAGERTGAAEDLLPVKSGMSLEAAYAAIGGNGVIEQTSDGKQALKYMYYVGSAPYSAAHIIGSDGRTTPFSMLSAEAMENNVSRGQCRSIFRSAIDALSNQFGRADFTPNEHRENGDYTSFTTFTFGDTTNIKVTYSFPENAGASNNCVVAIQQRGAWATSNCLFPTSRNCNFMDIYPSSRMRMSLR